MKARDSPLQFNRVSRDILAHSPYGHWYLSHLRPKQNKPDLQVQEGERG